MWIKFSGALSQKCKGERVRDLSFLSCEVTKKCNNNT
jgi:hypothetical protein